MKKLIIPAIVIWSFILGNFVNGQAELSYTHSGVTDNNGITYWTITLTSWDISITMLDRNLWATATWYWATDDTNTYWYYFQRWSSQDNIWRSSSWFTSDKVDEWWWGEDTYENWYYKKRGTSRKWPCPDWYHVPSSNEWNMLLYIYALSKVERSSNYDAESWICRETSPYQKPLCENDFIRASTADNFISDFLLPFAWYKSNTSEPVEYQWSYWFYRNSSFYSCYDWIGCRGRAVKMNIPENQFGKIYYGEFSPARGASVRCFKDDNNDYSAYYLLLRPSTYWSNYDGFIHPRNRNWITLEDNLWFSNIYKNYNNYTDQKRWHDPQPHGRWFWNISPVVLPEILPFHGAPFLGWYTGSSIDNLNKRFEDGTKLTGHTTLYGKWDRSVVDDRWLYSIKDGNNILLSGTIWSWDNIEDKFLVAHWEWGSSFDLEYFIKKAGYKTWYTLVWIYKDAWFNTEYDPSIPVTSDVTIYTKWQAPTYTVTFESNWGSYVEPQTVEQWMRIQPPLPVPTYPWHNFIGWFTDSGLNNDFDTSTFIMEDTTLYAKREVTKFTVTPDSCFQLSGGTIIQYLSDNENCWRSVVIPDKIWWVTVTSIWDFAFLQQNIYSVTLWQHINKIWMDAFAHNQLRELIIPNSVKTIWDWAFYENELTDITIPEWVTNIWEKAFSWNKLTSIEIPDSVETIWNYAFCQNAQNPVSVTLNDSLWSAEEDITALNNACLHAFNPNAVLYTVTFDWQNWNPSSQLALSQPTIQTLTVESWTTINLGNFKAHKWLYKFIGWSESDSSQTVLPNEFTVTKNITLYAVYWDDEEILNWINKEQWNITYTDTNWKVFTWIWTITITNWTDSITILDRNLWATTTDLKKDGSLWYYFQWWNNYGFTVGEDYIINNGLLKNSTDAKVNALLYSWNHPYQSSTFITNRIRWDSNNNDLRWWSWDYNNNRWTSTEDYKRQWPCPAWYHVPSQAELTKLLTMYYTLNSWWWEFRDSRVIWSTFTNNFRYAFNIPLAGYIDYNSGSIIWNTWYAYLWSSSIFTTAPRNIRVNVNATEWEVRYKNWLFSIWYASSIRCFKDHPLSDGTYPLILKYETNGWSNIESQTIPVWEKWYLPWYTTHKTGDTLEWWMDKNCKMYTMTEDKMTFRDLTISEDLATDGIITVYAKWSGSSMNCSEPTTYTVTRKNSDWTTLEIDTGVQYWTTPSYNWVTPTSGWNAQYSYTFAGWNPAISAVTGNITYTATYTTNWWWSSWWWSAWWWGWWGWSTTTSNNHIYLSTNNKYPSINEYINLSIETDNDYFSRLTLSAEYKSSASSSWYAISNTSSTYFSDYSSEWKNGYYKMKESDYGEVILDDLVQFKKSGYYRIYVEDIYWNKKYILLTVNNKTNGDIQISASPSTLDTDEWIKLTIFTDEVYTGRINFSKFQYKSSSSSSWSNISRTSSTYVSDYSSAWYNGYYKMTSSDDGKAVLKNLVKFKKSWYYRIYAEDIDGNESYVQINVNSSDDSSSNDRDLKISISPSLPYTDERIKLTIESNDNYNGILILSAKYKNSSSSTWSNVSNTSSSYFSDYSNEWKNGYYMMKSSDYGEVTLKNLVQMEKSGYYRIYVEDIDWNNSYTQIYVNQSNQDTNDDNTNTKNDNTKDEYDIEDLLNNLLNMTWSSNSDNYTNTQLQNTHSSAEEVNNTQLTVWDEIYISRSCKPYTIQYIEALNAYTSPDLKKNEYFVNTDYFKRYIDSKNAQNAECYYNRSWIPISYTDTYEWEDRVTAPNWKIYFIDKENNWYSSKQLSSAKSFSTINDIKSFIKKHNPLTKME